MKYVQEARARATRRQSFWNVLLLPAILLPLFAIWGTLVYLAEALHTYMYPGQVLRNAVGVWAVVTAMAPVFVALPLAMLIGNALLWRIAPARRALNAEAALHPGSSFHESQSFLRKVVLYAAPLAVFALLLGASLPW